MNVFTALLSTMLLVNGLSDTNVVTEQVEICSNIIEQEKIDFSDGYGDSIIYSDGDFNFHDEYESNDTIDSATCISQNDNFRLEEYELNVDGTLFNDSYLDSDWFYFVLLTDSVVNINIVPQSSESYAVIFRNYEYEQVSNSQANRELNDLYYSYDTIGNVNFTYTLKSGTYFITLYGNQEYDSYIGIGYSILIDVEVVEKSPDVAVDDLLESRYLGALWLSDYVPANYIPFLNIDAEIVYYQHNQLGINQPEYILETLKELSNNDAIHVATYYISDPVTKHIMYQLFEVLIDEYNDKIAGLESQIKKYELIHDATENAIKIFCTIGSRVVEIGYIQVGLKVLQHISLPIIDFIFNTITPKIDLDAIKVGEFLGMYKGYFDLCVPADKYTDYEYISANKRNGEVVIVPIYYSLEETNNPFHNQHYISYLKTGAAVIDNYDSMLLGTGDLISSIQRDSYYCRGKIYGLKSFDELIDINSLELFDKTYHFHEYTFDFLFRDGTYHLAVCKCGVSKLEAHAVGIDKICVRCKALVDNGFFPGLMSFDDSYYITENGSYIDSKGVIHLHETDIDSYFQGDLIFVSGSCNVKEEHH